MTAETHKTTHENSHASKAPPHPSAPERSKTARGDGQDHATEAVEAAATAASQETMRTMDMMQPSLRIAADIQQPALELVHDQTRRAADAVAQFTSAFHKATESTMDDVQALTMACTQFGTGMQEWQHACADLANISTEHTIRAQQILLGCRTPSELARAQQDLYRETVGFMVQASNKMLELSARIAQEAAKPLQGRAQKYIKAH